MERKLATIKRITEMREHPNADALELAIIGGWQLVTAKANGFKVGDAVVYLEIDSWVPTEIADFLSKGKPPREFNGVKGERLRTIRLRGQLSQGLILPIPAELSDINLESLDEDGIDVTDRLGIQKWERAIPGSMQGRAKGNFPTFIFKTDQERCLSGDTMIKTDTGFKSIKEICDTKYLGLVESYNISTGLSEFKEILGHSIVKNSPKTVWLKISLESGKEIICTNNHKIYMPNLTCYREAGLLQLNDELLIM